MVLLTTWDGVTTPDDSIEILSDLSLAHCQEAGAVADELAGFIRQRDFAAVCGWDIDYGAGYTPHELLHLRQALALFQKVEGLDLGIDKEAVARKKFQDSEVQCLRTNALFEKWMAGAFNFTAPVNRILHAAKRKIATVLGDVPSLDRLDYKFGPGATTSVPKRNACARTKLSAVPSCSANLLPLVPALMRALPKYAGLHNMLHVTRSIDGAYNVRELVTVEQHHGRLAFVPKNARTYRTIMTEPTLNGLVQGAIGRYIALRLLLVGQDIKDQTRNQRLAREGSLTGGLATLDLSSASDSISIELVAHLLPVEWYCLLSLARTPTIEDGGEVVRLHKFSSMGNGFTFPLQTLIFWALASSCVDDVETSEKRVSVYGDDIILGTEAVPLMRHVLHCTGFTLNAEKSYWDGPFRESCGKDYYKGFDIRPCYVDTWVSGATLFTLHNFYYRAWMFDYAARVRKYIDDELAIYGPDGYGDGHLLGDWKPKPHKRNLGYGGYIFDTYTYKPRYHTRVMIGDGVLPAYCSYVGHKMASESFGDGVLSDLVEQPLRPVNTRDVTFWGNPSTTVLSLGHKPRFPRSVRRYALDFRAASNPTLHRKVGVDAEGEDVWDPWLVVPGVEGYHRISIYTLSAQ